MRGHVCFRDELGPRRPFTRSTFEPRFRDAQSHCALDPRPRPPARFAMFTRSVDKRFSGSGCRPTTSATALPTHGHTPEHPILAVTSERPAFAVTPRLLSCSPDPCGPDDLPLSKKDHECCEPLQSLRDRPYVAASAPQSETPKAAARSRRRLRATPRSDHRLRRWPLDNSAGLDGPSRPERRIFPPGACCRRTPRAKVPLLT